MSAAPLVSILIPAHKPTHFLATLESALRQGQPELEIVLSDDSPNTDIAGQVDAFRADPRLRYERFPDSTGLVSNYRRLLDLARGRWALFLDDDDLLYPDAIADLLIAAQGAPDTALAYAGYDWQDQLSGENYTVGLNQPAAIWTAREFFQNFKRLPPVTVTVLFNVERARQAGIFSLEVNLKSADWNAWLRLALHGSVAYCPKVLGCHFRHAQSFSAVADLAQDIDNALFIEDAYAYALRRAALPPPVLSRWRGIMLRWYLTWIFASYIPRTRLATLVGGLGQSFRKFPGPTLFVISNPVLWASYFFSLTPDLHARLQRGYRRIRFGPALR